VADLKTDAKWAILEEEYWRKLFDVAPNETYKSAYGNEVLRAETLNLAVRRLKIANETV
jgi:hypothetical protein